MRLGTLGLAVGLVGLAASSGYGQQAAQVGFVEKVIDNSRVVLKFPSLESPTPLQTVPAFNPKEYARSGPASPQQPFDRQQLLAQSEAGAIIPLWQGTASVGNQHYNFFMVGKSPFTHQTNPVTSIKTILIPVRWTFTASNTVFDPTTVDHVCSPKGSAVTMARQSPIFQNITFTSNRTNIGTGQYIDLFQRASFWNQVKPGGVNPGYHVKLALAIGPTVAVNANNFPVRNTPCGKQGLLEVSVVQNYIKNTLVPGLASHGVTPTTFPLFLFYNVVMYTGQTNNCCTLGYHDAMNNPSFNNTFQTFGVANYDSSRKFGTIQDASMLSHEVGEWIDDPTVHNFTPPWGHIGQVAGCQNNLETGDPLSPKTFAIKMSSNNFTYHVQDLAFISWFYHLTNFSVNGWFSMYNTLKTPAAACH